MKRGILAALIVLLALVGMSAAAEETITARSGGYYAVKFSNGYTGFCIDRLLGTTNTGGEFINKEVADAVSNVPLYTKDFLDTLDQQEQNTVPQDLKVTPYNKQDKEDDFYDNLSIDQYLKLALVYHHDKLFIKNGDGGYYDAYLTKNAGNINTGNLFWVFSDSRFMKLYEEYTKNGVVADEYDEYYKTITGYEPQDGILDIIIDVIDRFNNKESIEDHSKKLYSIDDDTKAQFDFMVLDSNDDQYQDYFCFKITYYRNVKAKENSELIMNASVPGASYTWEREDKNGEFIPMEGKTESTLSIDPVTQGDHGDRYRCKVVTNNYEIDTIFTVSVNGLPDVVPLPEITPPPVMPDMPKTGDHSALRTWGCLACLACCAIALHRKKRFC